jgi:hypothetical protein
MRTLTIIYSVFIVLLSSCEKIEDVLKPKCDYKYSNYRDTLLCISFVESGIKYKFFQTRPALGHGADITSLIYEKNNITNLIYKRNYLFKFTKDKSRESLLNLNASDFIMEFSETFSYTDYKALERDSDPSNVFMKDMLIAYNKDRKMQNIDDTMFFKGISLSNSDNFSTDNVFNYYKFNANMINDFFNGCFIKIVNLQKECDNVYKIEGVFDVKLMKVNPDNTYAFIHLQNGVFKIIRRFK